MTHRNRLLAAAVLAVSAAVAAGLGLSRVLAAAPLWSGLGIGAIGAVLVTVSLGLRVTWAARVAAVLAVAWAVPAVAAADVAGPAAVPRQLSTLLALTWPAEGLAGLTTVPACLAFVTGALSGWRAVRGHVGGAAAAAAGGFVFGAAVAGPVGVPWWSPGAAMVVVGGALAVGASRRFDDLPPLAAVAGGPAVTTPTAARRRWSLAATALVPAIVLGAAAVASPTVGELDMRRWVHASTVTVADDNPLAIVARAIDDPPDEARAVDVEVLVDGPTPGRLRLAVLDAYGAGGWRQAAAFGPTGRRLPGAPVAPTDLGDRTTVRVHQLSGSTGLRAAPTAGTPLRVDDPGPLRYAPDGGVLLAADGADVTFVSLPAEEAPAVVAQPNVANLDPALSACPASPLIEGIAAGIVGDTLDPVSRLRSIESYLKFRRVYDPGAPGGQTIGSIERFLAQDFARGNVESFVTSFALLARCAGVPVRVVVGYPAPGADAATRYAGTDLIAWVETPLTASGWVPFDPVPTPEEQARQARAAQQPPPAPAAPPDIVEPARRAVTPRAPGGGRAPWGWIVAAWLAAVAVLAVWTFGLPAYVEARRRQVREPARTTLAAWATVTDRLVDRRVPLGAHMTPTECTGAAQPLPPEAGAALRALAALSDQARYDAASLTPAEAAAAWQHARQVTAALPRPWSARLLPLRAPHRAWRRLGSSDRRPIPRHP